MKTLLLAVALLGITACAPGPAAAGFSLSIGQPGFGLFITDEAPPPYYPPPVAYVPPPPVIVHHRGYYAPRVVHRHDHGHGWHHGRGRGRHKGWHKGWR